MVNFERKDTYSLQDLIEILGREYVGLGVVADKAFVKITKGAASV